MHHRSRRIDRNRGVMVNAYIGGSSPQGVYRRRHFTQIETNDTYISERLLLLPKPKSQSIITVITVLFLHCLRSLPCLLGRCGLGQRFRRSFVLC
jgi:hypothetical protein